VTGGALAWLWLSTAGLAFLAGAETPAIVVNPGRYGPSYHLRLALTAAAIDFSSRDKAISSGGQFTVRLRPDHFPVAAPHCRGPIILRMPWTSPVTPDAASKIAEKRSLFERILMLEKNPQAEVPVVLELNPYVEVASRTPLRLELKYCNVFFRHASGAYVDHTNPLQRQ
jgi:hypothetical protein